MANLLAGAVLMRTSKTELRVIDACAGRGMIGISFSKVAKERTSQLTYIEQDTKLGSLPEDAKRLMDTRWVHGDVFDVHLTSLIKSADIILCNPPFMRISKMQNPPRPFVTPGKLWQLRDIGCYTAAYLAQQSAPGALLGFILRKDFLFSSGYEDFRQLLVHFCEVIEWSLLGRSLKDGSGAAESIVLVCRRRHQVDPLEDLQRQPWGSHQAFYNPPNDWAPLGHFATVKAGWSVRGQLQRCESAMDCTYVMSIKDWDPDKIWQMSYSTPIKLSDVSVSARRNSDHQGRPGICYKLAGGEFQTSILPEGHFFFSNCPAIQPRDATKLDLITGIAMVPSWRRFVRASVRSTNFSPGYVAMVPIPFSGELGRDLAILGALARKAMMDCGFTSSVTLDHSTNAIVRSLDDKIAKALQFDRP